MHTKNSKVEETSVYKSQNGAHKLHLKRTVSLGGVEPWSFYLLAELRRELFGLAVRR